MPFLTWILSCYVTLEKETKLFSLKFFHSTRLFGGTYLFTNLLTLILTIPYVTYAELHE